VSPAQASLPRSWPTPELRIPNAAAQTRIVSKARIRLDSRKSVRSFKGIICVDISEFESFSIGAGWCQALSECSVDLMWDVTRRWIRRMRWTNLQRRPCRKTYGRHQDSKRTRLIHRPAGTSLHRSAEFTFSPVVFLLCTTRCEIHERHCTDDTGALVCSVALSGQARRLRRSFFPGLSCLLPTPRLTLSCGRSRRSGAARLRCRARGCVVIRRCGDGNQNRPHR
jgi:hypothetical protein